MFKILLVLSITLWISTALGLIIQSRFKLKSSRYTAPLGFAALISGLQLIYYPAQLFNLSSMYIHSVSFSVYVVLGLLSLRWIKQIVTQYFNFKTLWLFAYIIVFLFLLYSVSIAIPRSDSQMYLNYIAQNVNIDHLNLFNLWTGLYGQEFVTVYLFQGYYHFSSFIVYFVNIFYSLLGIGGYIENIVISVWGLGILYAIISGLTIINMVESFEYNHKWTSRILLFFTLFFTNMYYWKINFAFYGNTWRSLWMASLMYYLVLWIKERNNNYRWVAAFVFGASIASSSSSLFIGFAILFGLAYYLIFDKRKHIFRDLSYIALPMVLFVLAIKAKDAPNQLIVLLPITLGYYLVHRQVWFERLILKLEDFLIKYSKWIFIVIVPIIAIIYSIIDMQLDPSYPWNFFHYFDNHAAYDMMKDYLFIHSSLVDNILNVIRWGSILVLIKYYKQLKEQNYLRAHFIILAVLFLNPLTTSFISKNFASNVYYRSFEALFNVFTEVFLLGVLLNFLSQNKFLYRLVSIVLIVSVIFTHFDSYLLKNKAGQYGYYVVEGESILPLYKIKNSEYDAIKNFQTILEDFETTNSQVTVVSHVDGLRTFLPNVYQVFTARQYWSSWDRIDQDFYQVAHLLYGWDERPNVDYSLSCTYLLKYKIDFVINEVWENDEFDAAINSCTEIRYENYEYKVREVIKTS